MTFAAPKSPFSNFPADTREDALAFLSAVSIDMEAEGSLQKAIDKHRFGHTSAGVALALNALIRCASKCRAPGEAIPTIHRISTRWPVVAIEGTVAQAIGELGQ